jgi:acetyl esterase/lipase
MLNRNSVLGLLAFTIGFGLWAQNYKLVPPVNVSHADFPESEAQSEHMQVLQVAAVPPVLYRKDVTYVSRDGLDLTLQILAPRGVEKPLPCIVYVQGSAWFEQNVYSNLPSLAAFAKRGYVIAMVQYRPSTVAPFPAQLQDAKTAIRYMRQNAEIYHVDPNNIFIWGDSSGGHTALMVGLTQNHPELDTAEYPDQSIKVNAVVDFYGPTDISQMNYEPSIMDHIGPKTPEGMLIGGKNVHENLELAARTNPINYIAKGGDAAPIFILHGSKDRLVPFKQSVLLANALKANGYAHEFYQLKGADHGSNEFWTEEIFDRVHEFLRSNTQ